MIRQLLITRYAARALFTATEQGAYEIACVSAPQLRAVMANLMAENPVDVTGDEWKQSVRILVGAAVVPESRIPALTDPDLIYQFLKAYHPQSIVKVDPYHPVIRRQA